MIPENYFAKAGNIGAQFVPEITEVKYHPTRYQVELVTQWGTIIVNRHHIEKLRGVSAHEMGSIQVHSFVIHIEEKDIDINSASLIICIARRLETEATKSLRHLHAASTRRNQRSAALPSPSPTPRADRPGSSSAPSDDPRATRIPAFLREPDQVQTGDVVVTTDLVSPHSRL